VPGRGRHLVRHLPPRQPPAALPAAEVLARGVIVRREGCGARPEGAAAALGALLAADVVVARGRQGRKSDAQGLGRVEEGLEPTPRHRRAPRVHEAEEGREFRALHLREDHRDRLAEAAPAAVGQQHLLQQTGHDESGFFTLPLRVIKPGIKPAGYDSSGFRGPFVQGLADRGPESAGMDLGGGGGGVKGRRIAKIQRVACLLL
jgi:hypothetical protein